MTQLDLQAMAICDSTVCRLHARRKVGALGTSYPNQVGFSRRRASGGGQSAWNSGRQRKDGVHWLGMRANLRGRDLTYQEISGWSPADE